MRVTWVSHSEHNALMVDLCQVGLMVDLCQVGEEWAFALMTAIVTIVKKNCITKPINYDKVIFLCNSNILLINR